MDKAEIKLITDYLFLHHSNQLNDLEPQHTIGFVFGTSMAAYPIKKVKELYDKKVLNKIVLTGGQNRYNPDINEAEYLIISAIKMGLPSDLFILEKKASNTKENVIFGLEVLDQEVGLKNIKTILSICKNAHARRTLMTLKRYVPEHINLLAIPYDLKSKFKDLPSDFLITKNTWHQDAMVMAKILDEYNKIPIYLAKGDIAEI